MKKESIGMPILSFCAGLFPDKKFLSLHRNQTTRENRNFMRRILLLPLLAAFACQQPAPLDECITPRPQQVETLGGVLNLERPLHLATEVPEAEAARLAGYLSATDLPLADPLSADDRARLPELRLAYSDDASLPVSEEGYRLTVSRRGVEILSRGDAGLFYGLQTLLQLHDHYGQALPCVRITDAPRFPYRGLHLDVSRHFFDKEFVKKQLRMMARLKLNRFHWHLTDGAGWRIEIDRYPLLTEVAAWRHGSTWQAWRDGGYRYARHDDPEATGGYYTKAEIREVVALADSLHITVIPEIEMPAHSEEVLAVYPALSCSGRPYTTGDFCIGNEATFEFLENVLTEVMELFPSKWIHIGGDEASKTGWTSCPKCRERMRHEGLTTVDQLQSYAIHRIGDFLAQHGRRLIGWDEILDGGLAPDAVVMSWRGEEGGRKAAAAGHDVVMTPGSHCYFDGYQDNPTTEPQAFSGYLPLRKVYAYDPAPETMPGHERIQGVQANLWTEYIPTPQQAEYMLYPRLFALAEVAWSDPARMDYTDFHRRALDLTARARRAGYNAFDLTNEQGERLESLGEVDHLARGCRVDYATPWSDRYPAAGVATLTDGIRGSWSYNTRWQGFLESDVEVTIDLGQNRELHEVTADFIQWFSAWVWLPKQVEIALSDDGREFRTIATLRNDYPERAERPEFRAFGWQGADRGRYVRYRAIHNGRPGGWLFTDEIIVR